ncbi:hypothetical protein VNO77_43026 [Canavalia gladiata]|uniref:Uncharacterized protein n=1 Tax=Canavalia gladiata TaxID=3824 RepID=A0AAN9JVK0_CANGL
MALILLLGAPKEHPKISGSCGPHPINFELLRRVLQILTYGERGEEKLGYFAFYSYIPTFAYRKMKQAMVFH